MTKDFAPPPGPPPGWQQRQSEGNYEPPTGPPPGWQQKQSGGNYQPPAGPPTGRYPPSSNDYAAPPGPPPSYHEQQKHSDDYAPPPGPPPSHSEKPGAGQSSSADPPPYHDWTVIPDTALLPPPPQLTNEFSPTANAPEAEGEAAYRWGLDNPLWQPRPLPPAELTAIQHHAHTLLAPQGFTGSVSPVRAAGAMGRWHVSSRARTRDSCLQTLLPLYSALADSPLQTQRGKTVYFELRVLGVGPGSAGGGGRFRHQASSSRPVSLEQAEAGIALGFFAPPYLGWRLPGWQRGSLAVHGDDGRRYVNDTFGGVEFTGEFRVGETLGIGMTWKPKMSDAPPTYGSQQSPLAVDVFLTRDGRRDGGWDLHEEADADRQEGGTKGLDGECDVFAAVGIFGQVEVEVRFSPRDWMYQPPPDKGGW